MLKETYFKYKDNPYVNPLKIFVYLFISFIVLIGVALTYDYGFCKSTLEPSSGGFDLSCMTSVGVLFIFIEYLGPICVLGYIYLVHKKGGKIKAIILSIISLIVLFNLAYYFFDFPFSVF